MKKGGGKEGFGSNGDRRRWRENNGVRRGTEKEGEKQKKKRKEKKRKEKRKESQKVGDSRETNGGVEEWEWSINGGGLGDKR